MRKVVELTADPDVHLAKWLDKGAPMGIREEIQPSGLLPLLTEDESPLESLEELAQWDRHHPSFDRAEPGQRPPV